MAEIILRVLALLATLAAAVITALNKEGHDFGVAGAPFIIVASYKASAAFKFFLVGNAIASLYSLISLPFSSKKEKGFLMNLLDLMSMVLVMASASAATAIAYVGKNGNDTTGWAKICGYYAKFCNRGGIGLACSYAGFFFLFLICVLSLVHKARQSI